VNGRRETSGGALITPDNVVIATDTTYTQIQGFIVLAIERSLRGNVRFSNVVDIGVFLGRFTRSLSPDAHDGRDEDDHQDPRDARQDHDHFPMVDEFERVRCSRSSGLVKHCREARPIDYDVQFDGCRFLRVAGVFDDDQEAVARCLSSREETSYGHCTDCRINFEKVIVIAYKRNDGEMINTGL